MAIEQVKTISELERLPSLLDSYALAVSTGATTGSSTLLEMANYLKTYLQDVTKKIQTINESSEEYPSSIAVKNYVEGYAQALTSLVQNLDSPAANTYPSTQAVKNESNRIINLMDSIDIAPAWDDPVSVSFPYTAPSHGWLIAGVTRPGNENAQGFIRVNGGLAVCSYISNYNTASGYGNTQVMVRKNDVLSLDGRISVNYATFIRLPLNIYPGI